MEITDQQRNELRWLGRHGEPAHVRPKALVLLNLADGRPMGAVAAMFHVSRQSIYAWCRRYLDAGIQGLQVRRGRGRRPRASLDELERYVRQSPRTFGLGRTRWTLTALAEVVPSVKGFSAPGVMKALARAGIRYKRGQPRLHSPDPGYEVKKGLWRKR